MIEYEGYISSGVQSSPEPWSDRTTLHVTSYSMEYVKRICMVLL